MNTLIVYYSFTKNNQKLAHWLHGRIDSELLEIEELKERTNGRIFLDVLFKRLPSIKVDPVPLEKFDHIIFISPIWLGKIATPLKTFIAGEGKHIKEYSFITVCGGAADQLSKIEKQLVRLVGKKPIAIAELSLSKLLSHYGTAAGSHELMENDFVFFESTLENFLSRCNPSTIHSHSVASYKA